MACERLQVTCGYAVSDWWKHRPILIYSARAVCLLIRQLLISAESRCISQPSGLFLLLFCTMPPSSLSFLNKLMVIHSLQIPRRLDFLQLTTTAKVVIATTAFLQKQNSSDEGTEVTSVALFA